VKQMTSKEQVLKMIEGRIDTMQTLALESIELLYNAGYNEAIQDVLSNMNSDNFELGEFVRRLKK